MDYVIFSLGVALVVAPFALDINAITAWLIAVPGVVVAGVGGFRAVTRDPEPWEEWSAALAAAVALGAVIFGRAPSFARPPVIVISAFVIVVALVQWRRAAIAARINRATPPPTTAATTATTTTTTTASSAT